MLLCRLFSPYCDFLILLIGPALSALNSSLVLLILLPKVKNKWVTGTRENQDWSPQSIQTWENNSTFQSISVIQVAQYTVINPYFCCWASNWKQDRSRACVHFLSEWRAKREIAGLFFLVLMSFAESIRGILKKPIHMHGRGWQLPFQDLKYSIWETEVEKHVFMRDKKKKIHSFLKDLCSLVIYMRIVICYKSDEF